MKWMLFFKKHVVLILAALAAGISMFWNPPSAATWGYLDWNVVLLNGSGGRIPKNWRFSELGRCLLQALEIHSNAGIFALESLLFSLHAGNQ